MVLQKAAEFQDLLAGLLELRVNIELAVHALDRVAAQACDRTRGFDRELANLVLLIEAGLDLFDHVVEVLHRRADGPSRYLRVGPQAKGANLATVRATTSRPCSRWLPFYTIGGGILISLMCNAIIRLYTYIT